MTVFLWYAGFRKKFSFHKDRRSRDAQFQPDGKTEIQNSVRKNQKTAFLPMNFKKGNANGRGTQPTSFGKSGRLS